jgi:ATP-binding cassette subfamily B protein
LAVKTTTVVPSHPSASAAVDLQVIERYTGQPTRLPSDVRTLIEAAWGDDVVRLYALADLGERFQMAQTWLVLGSHQVALAMRTHDGWRIEQFARAQITGISSAPALSADVIRIIGEPGRPPLAVLRYSHRQRRAFENLKFVLEEQLAGRVDPSIPDPDEEYAAGTARPVRDAQSLVAARPSAVLGRLFTYLKPYRQSVTIGLVLATFITLISLIPPYLAGHLIDQVIRPAQDGRLEMNAARKAAWLAIAAMGSVYLVRQFAAATRLRLAATIGEWVARDLRAQLYGHIQSLSVAFFSRKKTGSLITRVSADTDRLWDFIAFGIVDVSLAAVTLLALSTVLLTLDWRLGLVMTIPVPVLCFLIYRNGESMKRLFVRGWRKWSGVTDVLSDTIPGIRVVKAFNQEIHETSRFTERNADVTTEFTRIHARWTTFWPMLMLGVHGTTLAVWIFALPRLLGHEPALTAGTFVSFLLYTTMFIGPMDVIGQMARTMNRATSSAHRVFEVLDTQPEVRERPEPVTLEPVAGRVTFDNVSFAYDGVRQVLRGISFDVAPGEMIGLVGPSGGGKSTIANLIARFFDASGGTVSIDGIDVRDLAVGSYRRQIGMVLQDPYLFNGTICDNIRYGLPDAPLDAVVRAARAANAHAFIGKLTHGYDTVVGERGHTLSGGERQRISIARAILHNPRILILDEATSAVDTETEREIQEALDRLVHGRTVFAIAHRLSTLRNASRLLVIENGRLIESGTHHELVNRATGTYRRLYEMQLRLA